MGLFSNLSIKLNQQRWLQIGAENPRIKEVIDNFLYVDSIDVDKYIENERANEIVNTAGSLTESALSNARPRIKCSPSFGSTYVQERSSRDQFRTPEWFYIGYPDVIIWMRMNNDRLEKEFEEIEHDHIAQEYQETFFYRTVIEKFKAEIGKLECSI